MSEKPESRTRIAIVGTGGISRNHVRGILADSDRARCVALCDVSDENIRARDEELGGVDKHYHDWKVMLHEMGDEIDAVVIALPHHLHAPCILDCVEAGKHILCEKPMCISLDEGDRIVKAVEERGVIYMSAHNQLFGEAVQTARRMLDAGEIGQLYFLRSQDCFLAGGGTQDPFAGSWRSKLASQGGGELIDTGYHPTYRLLYLADANIVSVRGTMGRFAQHIEGEDTASVQVGFANGVIGEIYTSWAMPLPWGTHQIHLVGSKGQIFGSRNDMWVLRDGAEEPEKIPLGDTDQFVAQMAHFITCVREGKPPIHGPREGLQTLEIILKAAEGAEGWQQHAQV